MLKVVSFRLLGMIPVLLVLALAVFVLQQIAPVDPAVAMVGEKAPREVLERARHEMGLDRPLPVQYVRYIGHLMQGNLGTSAVTRRSVRRDLGDFLPATLELVLFSFVLILVFGTLLGMATAQGWRGSGVLRALMIGGSSIPVFLTALLGMLLFYRKLGWLPATGRSSVDNAPNGPTHMMMLDGLLHARFDVVVDTFRHLVLPGVCLAIAPAVSVGRVLRSSLTHTLRSDFVRTARAKGLGEKRILLSHALRNSLGPVLALAGLQIASLFGAAIVVELIFAYPGLGLYISQAIGKGDFNTVAGITVVLGALYVFMNTLVDLLQAAADPRVRF